MHTAGHNVRWLVPWHPLENSSPGDGTVGELRHETCDRHPLYNVPVRAIARRQDCDDVLFELLDGTGRFAVVHLTYHRETDPAWPETTFYENWQHFERAAMLPDHADWEA